MSFEQVYGLPFSEFNNFLDRVLIEHGPEEILKYTDKVSERAYARDYVQLQEITRMFQVSDVGLMCNILEWFNDRSPKERHNGWAALQRNGYGRFWLDNFMMGQGHGALSFHFEKSHGYETRGTWDQVVFEGSMNSQSQMEINNSKERFLERVKGRNPKLIEKWDSSEKSLETTKEILEKMFIVIPPWSMRGRILWI